MLRGSFNICCKGFNAYFLGHRKQGRDQSAVICIRVDAEK